MAFPKKFFRNDTAIGLVLALSAFAAYLATLSPTIAGEEDQGELAAAAATLGNSHPTGYPLFLLLGRVFSLLPLGDLRVILKLNLMSAVFCAAAVFVFYHLFLLLLRGGALDRTPNALGPVNGPVRAAAAAATLALAFSKTYWTNALNLEVYGLHLLFLATVTLLFLKTMRAVRDADRHGPRLWLVFVYVLGLSFAHHMMTILLAPACLWLYFSVHGFSKPAWLKMARVLPLFLLGLSAYAYLPLRAAALPVLNWGNPSTLRTFWLHISGHQYKAMMFDSPEVPVEKLALFVQRFPGIFGVIPLLFAAVGLWTLFRRDRRMLTFTVLLFLTCLLYAINYDFDDPNFYLNLHVATAVWIGAGLLTLLRRIPERVLATSGPLLVAFFVPAVPLALHYQELDDSKNFSTEDFMKNVLDPLDSGAVLITNQSQYISSPALYFQFVEGYRPDLIIIQESATGYLSYYRQLRSRYPDFARTFLGKAACGEDGLTDSASFVQRFRNTVWTVVDRRDEVPVYFGPDINVQRYYGDVRAVPDGLVLRAALGNPNLPTPAQTFHRSFAPSFSYRPLPETGADVENIRTYYAIAYVNQALYYGNLNDTAAVLDLLGKALAVKPGHPDAVRLLRWVRYGY